MNPIHTAHLNLLRKAVELADTIDLLALDLTRLHELIRVSQSVAILDMAEVNLAHWADVFMVVDCRWNLDGIKILAYTIFHQAEQANEGVADEDTSLAEGNADELVQLREHHGLGLKVLVFKVDVLNHLQELLHICVRHLELLITCLGQLSKL